MKREFVLFVLSFSIIFSIYGQEMRVVSFSQSLQDLYASTHLKTDINGDPCAVIKVQIPGMDNIIFEGWIVNQSYTPGEYILYVPNHTKKIIVKHPNFLPLEYVFPEVIEGKSTYKMVLKVPTNTDGNIVVCVKTNTPNAIMIFDGKEYSTETAQFSLITKAGTYPVKIYSQENGLGIYESQVTITDDDPFQEIECLMPSKSVYNVRYTAEKDVAIYIDKKKIEDIKRNSFSVSSGMHDVELKIEDRAGAMVWYRKTTINGNSEDVVADFRMSGILSFSYPLNATFSIEPASEESLAPSEKKFKTGQEIRALGNYNIVVSKKGYQSREISLSVGVCEQQRNLRVSLSCKADELDAAGKYPKAYKLYKKMADDNDDYGLYKVGEYYYTGRAGAFSRSEAVNYWKKAADMGNVEAIMKLQETDISNQEKLDYLRMSAKMDVSSAQFKLAEKLFQMSRFQEAKMWLERVKSLEPKANFYLGELYYLGLGVDKNVEMAKSYYMAGSCVEDFRCDERLADLMYDKGEINEACLQYNKLQKSSDIAKLRLSEWFYGRTEYVMAARKLLEINLDKIEVNGKYADLFCDVAHKLYSQDKSLACNLYQIYVDKLNQDDIAAYYRLGFFYEQTKPGMAFNYYQKGAQLESDKVETDKTKLSDVSSTCRLGYCYEIGRGVSINYEKAVECYRKAIANGYYKAYRYLGTMYANGYGVKKDIKTAVTYWKNGAKYGDKAAMKQLVKYYKHTKNNKEAKKWEAKLAD